MGYDIIERFNCGYSVEECNDDNIAGVISRVRDLQEQDYLEMSRAARAAAEHFDIANLSKDYEKVIEQTYTKFNSEGK